MMKKIIKKMRKKIMNKKMRKKGFLFTIATLLLLLSIFTLASVYLDRNKELQSSITISGVGDKLRYIEDDVISNAYSDLLGIKLDEITKASTVAISFNQALLAPGRDYNTIMNTYKEFVEGTYSTQNNVEVALTGFGNTFTIEPYDTLFEVNGENIYVYTMPTPMNYVESIRATVKVDAENNSICFVPRDDHAQHPEISVTFIYKKEGGGHESCTNSIQLDPQENNDDAGHQFFLETKNPSGSIEIKYGQITGMDDDGVLAILTTNINANVTQLDLEYTLVEDERIKIKGSSISISSLVGGVAKESEIILAEE